MVFMKPSGECPFLFILVVLKHVFYDSANQFHPYQQVVKHLSLLYQGKQQFGSSKVRVKTNY